MLNEDSLKNEQSGSTAITVMIKENGLFCANIGDSRFVIHLLIVIYHNHKLFLGLLLV